MAINKEELVNVQQECLASKMVSVISQVHAIYHQKLPAMVSELEARINLLETAIAADPVRQAIYAANTSTGETLAALKVIAANLRSYVDAQLADPDVTAFCDHIANVPRIK